MAWVFRFCCLLTLAYSGLSAAAEYHGQVVLGSVPVPGVTLTASRGDTTLSTVTDEIGTYSFADLPDGTWSIEAEMTGFAKIKRDVAIGKDTPAGKFELHLLPAEQIIAEAAAKPVTVPAAPTPGTTATEPVQQQPAPQDTADGLLINGSVNNAAASPFSLAGAFGNSRRNPRALYTGGIGLILDNSALDAQPFSLTGQNTPKPSYNDLTGIATLGGPIRIPHILNNGGNFFVGYQWTRNRSVATQSALVPTPLERNGVLPGITIPTNLISPQALALLALYPLPNFNGNSRYNYQTATVNPTHTDALQSRLEKRINSRNNLYGSFAFQSVRADSPNVLGYSDKESTLGLNTKANWSHRFGHQIIFNAAYQFSRFSTRETPHFENLQNISANAGIQGNNQAPVNWGPPTLVFASGIASLSDAIPALNHNQTSATSASLVFSHRQHNITLGGDFHRQQFNYLTQQNPRGTFTFTGAAAGSDLADFLLGTPDTSAIAFGNADKYLRESVYDAYATDDWRVSSTLTINAGARWEYSAPITELYDRLINLAVTPGFTSATPVRAQLRPDKTGVEPRIGVAWRPLSGTSLVIRGGYGIYYNTSVYQSIDTQLSQQPPLSKSFSVQNSATNPLTLANGFNTSLSSLPNTFAIDPNFRVGYAQNWQLSVQTDLPASLQMVATYLGIKGTRGLQEFLPNTYPPGAVNPCPTCPAGFVYLASNGNSTRESAQLQLRRRLHNGFTALAQYTFSKSIDDISALGGSGATSSQPPSATNSATVTGAAMATTLGIAGATIAQNWRDMSAERGLSNFDQRHLLNLQLQYTTGMGMSGGTLLSGWRGTLFKEWTVANQITIGSGLPLTPTYLAAVPGTGVTGTIRPQYTGAPLYASSQSGLELNPAAYTAPLPGQWGSAGRNSITGPAQFTLNTSMGRTFRLKDRFNLDLRIDSTNALNHVTYTSWYTTINSTQFGLPVGASAMRSLQTTLRLRF